MVDAATVERANAEAQARFRAMLDAGTLAQPDAPETMGYVRAERVVDALIGDAQWEAAQAAIEALRAEDQADALAAGDFYAGMPR